MAPTTPLRSFGDPRQFSIGFALRDDPDGPGGSGPDGWAALSLWVGGRNLTRGLLRTGEVTDVAELHILPVLRWFIEQWDPMFHESRLPVPMRSALTAAMWVEEVLRTLPWGLDDALTQVGSVQAFRERHSLGAAVPGVRLVDLYLRRVGEDVELSWTDSNWRSVDSGVLVVEPPGSVRLAKELVTEPLRSFLRQALEALAEVPEAETSVTELRGELEDLDAAARRRGRLTWMLGEELLGRLGGFVDAAGAFLNESISDGGTLSVSAPAMLFRSASPATSTRDAFNLWLLTTEIASGDAAALEPFRRRSPPRGPGDEVTADGYRKALELREQLQIDEALPLLGECDLETRILPRLGVDLRTTVFEDRRIEGAAIAWEGRRPTIVVNAHGGFSETNNGRRMTIAHELCHLLHDIDARGRVGVVSNPWAEYAPERRANAFAAMLLMPGNAIRELLPMAPDQWTVEDVRGAGSALGVSPYAFTRHLQNLGFIDEATRIALLNAWGLPGR